MVCVIVKIYIVNFIHGFKERKRTDKLVKSDGVTIQWKHL